MRSGISFKGVDCSTFSEQFRDFDKKDFQFGEDYQGVFQFQFEFERIWKSVEDIGSFQEIINCRVSWGGRQV